MSRKVFQVVIVIETEARSPEQAASDAAEIIRASDPLSVRVACVEESSWVEFNGAFAWVDVPTPREVTNASTHAAKETEWQQS